MRLLSSALFFSLGLAIGSVVSDLGGDRPSPDAPAAGERRTASEASHAGDQTPASPALQPAGDRADGCRATAEACAHAPAEALRS